MKSENSKQHVKSVIGATGSETPPAKPSPKKALSGVGERVPPTDDAVMQFLGREVETIKLAWSAIDRALHNEQFAGMLPRSEWMQISRVLGKLALLGAEHNTRPGGESDAG